MSPRPKRSQQEAEKRLGSHLRELRTTLGLTQREVREATGDLVGESYLSQLETGRIVDPSPNVLFELAKAYEIDYWDLMDRAGYVPPDVPANDAARLGWLPASTLEELDEDERRDLLWYIRGMKERRRRS